MATTDDNTLDLQDLYTEILVRQTIEQTRAGLMTWTFLGGTQFQATTIQGSNTWTFFITQTQVGNMTFKYSFQVNKNGVQYVTVQDGPLPATDRDSAVQNLYLIVSSIVLQTGSKIQEALLVVGSL